MDEEDDEDEKMPLETGPEQRRETAARAVASNEDEEEDEDDEEALWIKTRTSWRSSSCGTMPMERTRTWTSMMRWQLSRRGQRRGAERE